MCQGRNDRKQLKLWTAGGASNVQGLSEGHYNSYCENIVVFFSHQNKVKSNTGNVSCWVIVPFLSACCLYFLYFYQTHMCVRNKTVFSIMMLKNQWLNSVICIYIKYSVEIEQKSQSSVLTDQRPHTGWGILAASQRRTGLGRLLILGVHSITTYSPEGAQPVSIYHLKCQLYSLKG